jgi:hypothetical protein
VVCVVTSRLERINISCLFLLAACYIHSVCGSGHVELGVGIGERRLWRWGSLAEIEEGEVKGARESVS